MALNKEKARRIFMTYMVVVQAFFTVIGLALIGYYLGKRLYPDGDDYLYFTAIGIAFGVLVGFVMIYRWMKSEERYERRSRH